jgi:hypothetical protein
LHGFKKKQLLKVFRTDSGSFKIDFFFHKVLANPDLTLASLQQQAEQAAK